MHQAKEECCVPQSEAAQRGRRFDSGGSSSAGGSSQGKGMAEAMRQGCRMRM